MITSQMLEKNLRSNRRQLHFLAFQGSNQLLARCYNGDQMLEATVTNLPYSFDERDIVQQLISKPLTIDGEILHFQSIESEQILLQNDYNKKLTRAAISIHAEKKVMVVTAVQVELRKGQYRELCATFVQNILEEQKIKENNVVFKMQKFGYLKKTSVRQTSQALCICFCKLEDADPASQPAMALLKHVFAAAHAFTECYVVFAIQGLTKSNMEDYAKIYYYLDKVNLLDPTDENLENYYPTDKLYEIYISSPLDEDLAHFGIRDHTEIKKLSTELHSHLIKINYIKPSSEYNRFFDLTDDKKISVDGLLFNYATKTQKTFKHQACLLTTITDAEMLRQVNVICKQYAVFLVVSTFEDPQTIKVGNVITRLPENMIKSKFIYSDGHEAYFLNQLHEIIGLAKRYQFQTAMMNEESVEEPEVDGPLSPELSIEQNCVKYRGIQLSFLQKYSQYKEAQAAAVCFIDATMPDFEAMVEQIYVFTQKCPEIYSIVILRGVENEIFLKQKHNKTTLLQKMNILAYKSGVVKIIRRSEPRNSSSIFIYDTKLRLYREPFSPAQALREYRTIIEDLTNQPMYNERKPVKTFFTNTPQQNQFVFRGQIFKLINIAKPYLNQALVSVFMVQNYRNSKGDPVFQEINYDLNCALDVQKMGKSFVIVCLEGLTISNLSRYVEMFPILKQLNVVSDKDSVSKLRYSNKMEVDQNKFYFVINQISNTISSFSMASQIKTEIEKDDDATAFVQDETSLAENVIYNDLVFTYLQKIKQKLPDQCQCLIYLNPESRATFAINCQAVLQLQQKYPEIMFDVSLKNCSFRTYKKKMCTNAYYYQYLNAVSDPQDSATSTMQRDEFSFYLYDQQFELVEHAVGCATLIQMIESRFKYVDRFSPVQPEISDNDKSLVIRGNYIPYLRRVYHRSPHKQLVVIYLDADDDRFDQYLKQFDAAQQKYSEVYLVLLIKQIYVESYVSMLESHPLLNKFNVASNEYDIVDNVFAQNAGKTVLINHENVNYFELSKFQQAILSKLSEKEPTNTEIYFNGKKIQFIQQIVERHRKQLPIVCCIPKDEFTGTRIQQLYDLQLIYPEMYFTYFIEDTDIVSIQTFKTLVFKYAHLNIVKKLDSRGMQFCILNSKNELKVKAKTIQSLKQELQKLQYDLHQQRKPITPQIDCSNESNISYFGTTLDFYKKNYSYNDEPIVMAVLDPEHKEFASDVEKLASMRREQRLTAYTVVSLRSCAFDAIKNILLTNNHLSELNVVSEIPPAEVQGTTDLRFEVFNNGQCRLCRSVEDVQTELRGIWEADEVSDEDCFLDELKPQDQFYIEEGENEKIVFRGVRLQLIQLTDQYRRNDNAIFVYIDDLNGATSFERRLQAVYEMAVAYPNHFVVCCVRGIRDCVDISRQQTAFFIKKLNICSYRSGLSKMVTRTEKKRKLCCFYFSPHVEIIDNKQVIKFAPAALDNLILQQQKIKYVKAVDFDGDNHVQISGFRHLFLQKSNEFIAKHRYIVVAYITMDAFKVQNQILIDLSKQRDDVYVIACVSQVVDKQAVQTKQISPEMNVVDDDHDAVQTTFNWYDYEFGEHLASGKQQYEKELLRYRVLKDMEEQVAGDDEKKKQFQMDYGEIVAPKEFKSSKVSCVCLTFDQRVAKRPNVDFSIVNVKNFTERYGLSQRQVDLEKAKAPNSTIKIDGIEYLFIQKQKLESDPRQNIVVFLDQNSDAFSAHVNTLHQLQEQHSNVIISICIIGVNYLTKEHYTMAYNLFQMNVLADVKIDRKSEQFFIISPAGDIQLQNVGVEKIPLMQKSKIVPVVTDITGDKQLLFQGASYNYMRRILFKSINGFALFTFISRETDKFEVLIQQVVDTALKYPDVAFILFIENLHRHELLDLLAKYKFLHNVNIGHDRNKLTTRMLSHSNSGVYYYATYNSKEVVSDDPTKLESLVTPMGTAKGVSAKGDDTKMVVKANKGDMELRFIQKLYNRRATSSNPINNQRVCVCLIPDDKQSYNEIMAYETYRLQVRYPEMYFVLAVQGMTKDNFQNYQDRLAFLDRMNLAEVPNIQNFLKICDQKDVDKEGLPHEALDHNIYTFRLFDGTLKEDVQVSGTPQDEILAEYVLDKFGSREQYKYLAPVLDMQLEKISYRGFALPYLNKSSIKYDPKRAVCFVRIAQNEKLDQNLKNICDIIKQKQHTYFAIAVEGVGRDTVKQFIQQKPMLKNVTIVPLPPLDKFTGMAASKQDSNSDVIITVQTPVFDVFEKLQQQLFGSEPLPPQAKAAALAKFLDKLSEEIAAIAKFGEQDPINLDVQPHQRPADRKGGERNDDRYDYYDVVSMNKNAVTFRSFELKFLQKQADFADLLKKQTICIVTLSPKSLYEPEMFERSVKDIYDQQSSQEVGYVVLIENVYDSIALYQLSQTAYYLNKLTILQYKIGLNQSLRAAGEFVVDRVLPRERLFSQVNRFYYKFSKAGEYAPVPRREALAKYNKHKQDQLLEKAGIKYVVMEGALLQIAAVPASVLETPNTLVVVLRDENAALLEGLADIQKRVRFNAYVICKGVQLDNAQQFIKKYPFAKNNTLLADQNGQAGRICAHARRTHGVKKDVIILVKGTQQKWGERSEEIQFESLEQQAETEHQDDWWDQGEPRLNVETEE